VTNSGEGQSQAGGGGAGGAGSRPTEEQLRAAYEEQIKQVRVEDLILENVVTLINLAMRRTGLAPGTEDERDPGQVRLAIESVRSLLPLLEQSAPQDAPPDHLRQLRDALSQLQMAYVRIGGGTAQGKAPEPSDSPSAGSEPGPPGAAEAPASSKPGEPGPAQRSGRLWVPGQ
jgi:hypothetical protein